MKINLPFNPFFYSNAGNRKLSFGYPFPSLVGLYIVCSSKENLDAKSFASFSSAIKDELLEIMVITGRVRTN